MAEIAPQSPLSQPIKPLAPKPNVEELKRQWKTFQLYEEEPLSKYFFELDYMRGDFTYDQCWQAAQLEDPRHLTRLLFESWKWRADTRNNVVASTEGSQGTGKSLGNIYYCGVAGKIFDRPFNLATDLAFYPEEMESMIEHSQNRQTMMCDEQQQTNVGIMSNTIRNRLVDLEEQLRFSQANLFYVAPSLRSHAHYFVFEAVKPVRVRNKICNQCRKPTCVGCEVIEEKRSGYPAFFVFMLKTKRAQDAMLVPRGYILAKMPRKEIVEKYEQVKAEHIRRLKAKDSRRWEILKKLADEIWERGKPRILMQTNSGKWYIAPQKIIQLIFYEMKGMNALTNEAQELLITLVSEKAREYIIREGMNEEIEKKENTPPASENSD